MSKQRRTFSAEDRYSIVQESLRSGPSEVSRKYSLSPSLLRRWKEKYLASGKDGLRDSYSKVDPQVRALEEENERLKRIVAKQALELEVKSELLKKTPIGPRKR
jgi:transposase-like protein